MFNICRDSCILYDEIFCGHYKPYKKTEDLMSFNQLSIVLNVYAKYPELRPDQLNFSFCRQNMENVGTGWHNKNKNMNFYKL